jgi:beta-1,4-mannosyltransferase
VLPDLPTARFRPLDRTARDRFRTQQRAVFDTADASAAIVISPSAWTIDDDFDLLIEALRSWDAALLARGEHTLRALFVLTGAGERKLEIEQLLAASTFTCIAVRTAWFEPDDYPSALAAADLGLSLHRSANGADIPIKLSELSGCGIPVCALDSRGVRERIEDGVNGVLFSTAAELAVTLDSLLGNGADTPALHNLRAAVAASPAESWESCWNRLARPLFERLMTGNAR